MPSQPLAKSFGSGKRRSRAPHLDLGEARALHGGLQARGARSRLREVRASDSSHRRALRSRSSSNVLSKGRHHQLLMVRDGRFAPISAPGLAHCSQAHIAPLPRPRYGPARKGLSAMATSRDDTHFGYRTVPLAEKQGLVDDVFHSVARRYDLMNDLMSGGLHRAWKDALVDRRRTRRKGDRTSRCSISPAAPATSHSASSQPAAPARASRSATSTPRCWRSAASARTARARSTRSPSRRAMPRQLPYPDRSFDCVTIAFGIRNVPRIDRALAEAYRVLKIGGRFLCLEFSAVDVPGLDRALRALFVQGDPAHRPARSTGDARGLSLSRRVRSANSRRPQAFADMMRDGRLPPRQRSRPMTGGVVALHSGWRL